MGENVKCNWWTGCENDAVWADDKHNYCEHHFLHEHRLYKDTKCLTCGKVIPAITLEDIETREPIDIYCSMECAAKAYGYKRIGDNNV